jgi:Ser/Thr protein kinase RdoA (MazF antagonist)
MASVNERSDDLRHTLAGFALPGPCEAIEPFGSGLINATWRFSAPAGPGAHWFILQRLNGSIFPRPDQVMENISTVTGHLLDRQRREGETRPEDRSLVLVPACDGRSYVIDGSGACWRVFRFIEGGQVFDTVQGPDHAREVGRCLGRFQALLSDLDPDRLHDTLPGLHHTARYLEELQEAARADASGRRSGAMSELKKIEAYQGIADLLLAPLQDHRIPLRIVHNDPKVNNVLVHARSGKAICMLDLDTVKAGTVLFDFGDCVRSAANPGGEDAADLDEVRFDLPCYEAIRRGYLEEAGLFLTAEELALLPLSVRVITFELAVRFLADHLRGDTYFRVAYPGHNLHRARVQFRLLRSIEQSGIG